MRSAALSSSSAIDWRGIRLALFKFADSNLQHCNLLRQLAEQFLLTILVLDLSVVNVVDTGGQALADAIEMVS